MPEKITVYLSTNEHNIYPPGINDGTNSLSPGQSEYEDENFTTVVEPGQEIQFAPGRGDSLRIVSIGVTDRRTFVQFPNAENNFTGIVGTFLDDTVEYAIQYMIEGITTGPAPGAGQPIVYSQDPRLRMNR